jgi:hypothetical protein
MIRARLVALALGLAAAVGAIALSERRHHQALTALDPQVRAAERRLMELQVVKRHVDDFTAKERVLQRKVELIERLLAARPQCPEQVLVGLDSRTPGAQVDGAVYQGGFVAVFGAVESKAALRRLRQALAERGFEIAQAGGSDNEFGIFATLPKSFCKEPR